MSCDRLDKALADPSSEREHVVGCDECRLALSRLERVNRTWRDHRIDPPAGWESRLRARLAEPSRGARAWWIAGPIAAASVALIALVAFGLGTEREPTRVPSLVADRSADPGPDRADRGPPAPGPRTFGPGRATLSEGSQLIDESAPPSTKLRLDRGRVELTVSPVPSGAEFAVVTVHAIVKVVGTRFSVEVRASETEVRVTEGVVEVTHRATGLVERVPAGRTAVVSAAGPAAARPGRPVMSRSSPALVSPSTAEPVMSATIAPEQTSVRARPVETDPREARASQAPGATELLALADGHRLRAEWAEAAEAYGRVALLSGEFAEEAMYRQAEALLHLGRAPEALLVLDRAHDPFRHGALAPERAALTARAALSLGRLGVAAKALLSIPADTRELVELRLDCAARMRTSDGALAQALVEALRTHKDSTVRARAASIAED